MALIGYARVSSTDQSLEIQIDALKLAGCERIFQEKHTGRTDQRPEWKACLEFLREGDVLVFTRLDRLARSMVDLVNIGAQLERDGIAIRCLQQPVDTTTPEGRLLWGILAVVAEFEVDLKAERQREGIARAKADGKKIGGFQKKRVTPEAIGALKDKGLGAREIAKHLGCTAKTVYRNHPEGWGPSPIGA